MKRFFYFFSSALLALSPYLGVLTLASEVRFLAPHTKHTLSHVTILPGQTLSIGEGVTLILKKGSRIKVEGFLHIMGSAQYPVEIYAEDTWETLHAAQSATLRFEHVIFKNFQGPFLIETPRFLAQHLSLVDGLHNVLRFQESAQNATYELHNLLFQIDKRQPISSGVEVVAPNVSLQLFYTRFSGVYSINIPVGVRVLAPYQALGIHGTFADRSCLFDIRENIFKVKFVLELSRVHCRNNAPVLFIPGYGTSIHFAKLTNPTPSPASTDGWAFSRQLTSSYKYLLDAFSKNNIPYEVAYYDWRLPADVIVKEYINPAIERLKQQSGSAKVAIVAHSFGGLLARAYVQSAYFKSDISEILTIGTPHSGAVKAYPVWSGGEIPAEWRILAQLIRYYQYREQRSDTPVEAIRRYFPSVKELLPVFPFLNREGEVSTLAKQQNEFLQTLNRGSIAERLMPITALYSDSEPTLSRLTVTDNRQGAWEDGVVTNRLTLESGGDGTVSVPGARVSGAAYSKLSGSHAMLPAYAAEHVIKHLRPEQSYIQPLDVGLRQARDAVWFVADCPVTLHVIAPDGRVYTELEPLDGESFVSDDLLWLLVPQIPGEYQYRVTAKESTKVRYWVNEEPIHHAELQKGDHVSTSHRVAASLPPNNSGSITADAIVQNSPKQTELPSVKTINPLQPEIEIPKFVSYLAASLEISSFMRHLSELRLWQGRLLSSESELPQLEDST